LKKLSHKYLKFYNRIQKKILNVLEVEVEESSQTEEIEVRPKSHTAAKPIEHLNLFKTGVISNEEYAKKLAEIIDNFERKIKVRIDNSNRVSLLVQILMFIEN